MLTVRSLAGFLDADACDTHVVIEGRSLVMRCRKEIRPIVGVLVRTVVLSTIEVEPAQRGRGHFTAFLGEVEPVVDRFDALLVVEEVVNARLAWFLERRGYTPMATEGVLSYARLVETAAYVVDPRSMFVERLPGVEVEPMQGVVRGELHRGFAEEGAGDGAGLREKLVPCVDERAVRIARSA